MLLLMFKCLTQHILRHLAKFDTLLIPGIIY
jgi:hypothetical protein